MLVGCLRVPVSGDSAAFVLPSVSEGSTLTPLQEAALAALQHLLQHVTDGGEGECEEILIVKYLLELESFTLL